MLPCRLNCTDGVFGRHSHADRLWLAANVAGRRRCFRSPRWLACPVIRSNTIIGRRTVQRRHQARARWFHHRARPTTAYIQLNYLRMAAVPALPPAPGALVGDPTTAARIGDGVPLRPGGRAPPAAPKDVSPGIVGDSAAPVDEGDEDFAAGAAAFSQCPPFGGTHCSVVPGPAGTAVPRHSDGTVIVTCLTFPRSSRCSRSSCHGRRRSQRPARHKNASGHGSELLA